MTTPLTITDITDAIGAAAALGATIPAPVGTTVILATLACRDDESSDAEHISLGVFAARTDALACAAEEIREKNKWEEWDEVDSVEDGLNLAQWVDQATDEQIIDLLLADGITSLFYNYQLHLDTETVR